MTDVDFESAQLELLTEALRAGPGTPAWRDALAGLDAQPGADEYKLLIAARERLASGREYRELRAGPGFTRKVFDSIEQEDEAGGPRASSQAANLIAAAAALVIVAVLAIVAFFAIPRTNTGGGTNGDLSATYFTVTRAQTTFDTQLGDDWSPFGALPVEASNGLRPRLDRSAPATGPAEFRGGGVTYAHELPPDQPFAVEATVRLPKPSDDLITQVFITDDASFSGDRATSPHELVWLSRNGDSSLALPDGTLAGHGPRLPAGRSAEVRIAVNRGQAAVEVNGKRLWTGPHQLAGDKPRRLGVRFLARGPQQQKDAPVVESIRVLTPQKAQ